MKKAVWCIQQLDGDEVVDRVIGGTLYFDNEKAHNDADALNNTSMRSSFKVALIATKIIE